MATIQTNNIVDAAGTGAPDFPNGIQISSGGTNLTGVESGTYVPTTLSVVSGLDSVGLHTSSLCYLRINDIVMISGELDIDVTNANTLGQFNISVPTGLEGTGNIAIGGASIDIASGIGGKTGHGGFRSSIAPGNGLAQIFIQSSTNTGDVYNFQFMYKIP